MNKVEYTPLLLENQEWELTGHDKQRTILNKAQTIQEINESNDS